MAKKTRRMQQDYEVGFGKPPRATQFAKGQSGNPNGRPKGSWSPAKIVQGVLTQKVTIVENGCTRTVTKLEANMMQLANQGAAGNLRATREVIQLAAKVEAMFDQTSIAPHSNEQDRNVLAGLLKRIQQHDIEILGAPRSDDAKGTEE